MIKKTFIKISLSTSMVLLFILSCDERTPVSSPPAEVAYQLEMFVDNDSCDPTEETYLCTDGDTCDPNGDPCLDTTDCLLVTCEESTAYAANNALGQIEITARLQINTTPDDDDEMDGGYQGQNIVFSWKKDDNTPSDGYFQINEDYSSGGDVTNIGVTDVNGIVRGTWQDELALGNFEITATYEDGIAETDNEVTTTSITLISPESLINSVDGFTSAPNNTLEVPDNNIYTTNINATVSDQNGINLPNISVAFSKISGSGSLSSSTAITGANGIASVEYQTSPGTSDDIVTFSVNVDGPDGIMTDTFQLIVTSDIYPQEYYVKTFDLQVQLFNDNDNDGINDLILADEFPDSTYVITFVTTTEDSTGSGVENVPVHYSNTGVGLITSSTPVYTNTDGIAEAELNVNRNNIANGFGDILMQATIFDPEDMSTILQIPDPADPDNEEAFIDATGTIAAEVFTEQFAIVNDINDLLLTTEGSEEFENNNSITYETLITARTINNFGGLVTDPVMINFQKTTPDVGGYLTATSVMTDSTGKAESTFIVNSSDFETSGATNIDFNIFVQENSLVAESLTLSYFIEGSQDPESDVSEFHYYPDSDMISHALYEQTSISVIAKNDAGVGISNVLVRFDLDESRNSFGELSSGYEYTCCGDTEDGSSGEETYSCDDGSGCTPDGDPCPDGSVCSVSASGGSSGQSGVATVIYTNISEGVDELRAYVLDPNDATSVLWEDTIIINSIPSCPDCSEALTLISEDYTLPNTDGLEATNIYALYTDSLGNPASINDIITFEAIQYDNETNEWLNIGSITPEYAFFEENDVENIEDYLPDDFELEGSTVVYAEAIFNMENSSGLARIVGNYGGLSDTLGMQINSTEASFVEILAPYPSEIMVQGGGGQESTIITTEIRDGNGNLVNEQYLVQFEVTQPQLDGVHLNGSPGDIDETEISSNGSASVTLNSGRKPGTVHLRVTVKDHPLNENYDPDFEILAEATPVTITTGPPTSAVIGYAFMEALNIGGGLTEMPVSIMLWDAWANPVSDSTAIYFSLDPPTSAAIIAEAKTGNIKPNSGDEETWPGVAWTTTQYNSAQLFEFPEILGTTTGNICINGSFADRDACELVDNLWLPITSEEDGLCAVPTLTNPELCDFEDYQCASNAHDCDNEAASGFGTDPDQDNIYWGIALPITFSSQDNLVSYENVCVDCSLTLAPLSDTQHDFNDCAGGFAPDDYELELRAQLIDAYGVPVEGALVELIIFDTQGGPLPEGGGCYDTAGDPLIDPETGLPYVNQGDCEDATGVWGYGSWIDEMATYGGTQIQTDSQGLKYFKVTFNIGECVQTNDNPEQWTCTSPIIQANLLNPNGAVSEQLSITINNTCIGF